MSNNMPVHNLPAAARQWFWRFRDRVYDWLESPRFFYIIIGLLVFQALWIALTARYPQAFDEDFHFGLIQLHTTQWLPFFTYQPAGAEVHGAVVRDPSYLFHYLFSLVLRLLQQLTASQTVQITVLRLLDIGLFIAGLMVYRSLLIRLGLSRRIMHASLLFFVLTPVVPLLAANINYDNMIFLLTGAFFLYAVRFMQRFQRDRQFDVAALLLVLVYGLVAALVKYTTLPVTAATFGLIAFLMWRPLRQKGTAAPFALKWPSRIFMVTVSLLILALTALCLERYGYNLVRYHSLDPDCAKVLSVNLCHSYSVWERDYQWSQIYPHPSPEGIAVYPFVWIHRMVFETMFTISSRFGSGGLVEYMPAPPLTVANYTAWTLVIAATLSAAVCARRLWHQRYLRYLLLVSAFYTLILFAKNFSQYLHTGEAVAIHGRYLVPVYPLLYAAAALAFGYVCEARKRPAMKTSLVIVSLLFISQGAGLITWIYRSDSSWYWSQNEHSLVYRINRPVQIVIHRIVIP